MFRPGRRNLITDIAGLKVGHATDEAVRSGVTAVLCGAGWRRPWMCAAADLGTRETDALSPENLVGRAHAVVLPGGSVFGLAAADGVAAALSSQGIGLQLSKEGRRRYRSYLPPYCTILQTAATRSWGVSPPYRELGMRALAAADADFALGSVGAGRGAMAGMPQGRHRIKLGGFARGTHRRRAGRAEFGGFAHDARWQNLLGLGV